MWYQSAAADVAEANGMRVMRIAVDMASEACHHWRGKRIVEQGEQTAIERRAICVGAAGLV